jgi:hypothetical protein
MTTRAIGYSLPNMTVIKRKQVGRTRRKETRRKGAQQFSLSTNGGHAINTSCSSSLYPRPSSASFRSQLARRRLVPPSVEDERRFASFAKPASIGWPTPSLACACGSYVDATPITIHGLATSQTPSPPPHPAIPKPVHRCMAPLPPPSSFSYFSISHHQLKDLCLFFVA